MSFKAKIITLISKNTTLTKKDVHNLLSIPPNPKLGDYAFPCFKLDGNPKEAAAKLKNKIKLPKYIEKCETAGPYLNFYLNKAELAKHTIESIADGKEKYGSANKKNKIVVEYCGPNTNKPLHLGHVRNMAIGAAAVNLLQFQGNKTIPVNIINDRGVHICKSMLAYQKWGKGAKPDIKPDHYVGNWYVRYAKEEKKNPELKNDIQKMLVKWENKDKQTRALWKKMNNWAYEGFSETYKKLGIKHDKNYYESKIYKKGRDIINNGLKKKIFHRKSDGAIAIDLGEKLGEKIVLRADGTSLYLTQDLSLAEIKKKDYNPEKSIYVVASEQDYHFNVLTKILKILKSKSIVYHLSYGMVNLPEGKMKSREGNVVDADDLIENVKGLIKKELSLREKLSKKEIETRSLKIALAAIKYFLLKIEYKKNMMFNPKEALNFEGDTGTYLLYSYTRANSIIKKSKIKNIKSFSFEKPNEKEFLLAKKLSYFPEIALNSYKNLNPSLIANYSYQLAKIFNEFYHDSKVIGSDKETFRIYLVKSFRSVLKNSLNLLGIEPIERM
ncbi:TPA: arginine--tRNA ligase [Candidatus Woesearchaeota archaeon]|nr:arginine--tRNA ligase [Candidatus Woesearchaeota archaeon]